VHVSFPGVAVTDPVGVPAGVVTDTVQSTTPSTPALVGHDADVVVVTASTLGFAIWVWVMVQVSRCPVAYRAMPSAGPPVAHPPPDVVR
jgi:hypothetical protein